MSNKRTINDYSAFSTLFRDTALGIALSAGGLSTLLPNILEGVSDMRELDTFEALNIFSVIYFLFPVVLLSSFWLVRGYKLYIFEKLSSQQLKDIRSFLQSDRSDSEWTAFLLVAIVVLKFLPIALFVIDPGLLASREGDWLYISVYVGLVICELVFVHRSGMRLHDHLKESFPGDVSRLRKLCDGMQHISFLIFFLDLSIGLCLIIFSRPWITYNGGFYLAHACIVGGYGIAYTIWSVSRHPSRINPHRTIAIVSIIFLGAVCFPALNLTGLKIFSLIIPLVIMAFAILLVMRLDITRKARSKFLVYSLALSATISAMLIFVVRPGFYQVNRSYFANRLAASQQISTDEIFPLFPFADSTQNFTKPLPGKDDAIRKAKVFLVAREVDKYNLYADVRAHSSRDLLQRTELYDTVGKTYLKDFPRQYSLPKIYYGEYQKYWQDNLTQPVPMLGDAELDKFYGSVNDFVEDSVFNRFFKPAEHLGIRQELPAIHNYYHPMNYFAYNFKRHRAEKDSAYAMLRLVERIHQLHKVREMEVPQGYALQLQSMQAKTVNRLKQYYAASKDFQMTIAHDLDSSMLLTNPDHARIGPAAPGHQADVVSKVKLTQSNKVPRAEANPAIGKGDEIKVMYELGELKTFHENLFYFRQVHYAKLYESAQKIYKSYLLDSQRVGLYIFISTLVVIVGCSVINAKDNERFSPRQYEEEPVPLPADTPSKSLYVQALAIFILILPLLKTIKPQNIDPEKPYWMMSIQNWYAPQFAAKVAAPEDSGPSTVGGAREYKRGASSEINYDENNFFGGDRPDAVNLKSLEDAIKDLDATMQNQGTYKRPQTGTSDN